MRFFILSTLILIGVTPSSLQAQSCGCAEATELATRLKAVQAVMGLLDTRAGSVPSGARFDANEFDSGLGEDILKASMSAGGIGAAIPAVDFDRFSCDINTVPLVGGS